MFEPNKENPIIPQEDRMKKLLLITLVVLMIGSTAWSAPTAQEIVVKSDAIRNPSKPFSVMVSLTEYRKGVVKDNASVLVYSMLEKAGGQYKTLVQFRKPTKDVGKLILKNGNVLWFYDPAEKASVRISPQQRLLGQASNGDVVTINFQYDYKAVLKGTEKIMDAEKKERQCYKLFLTAKTPDVTYKNVEYWVDSKTFEPIRGRFYSDSNRLLKTAFYRGYQTQLGVKRPTEILILDGVDTSLITRMNYSSFAFKNIQSSWFDKSYLPRFKP